MTRLACACLRCRDAEYFYFDADAVRRYTSDILILTSGDQMCGQTHTGWSEEVYSFHQKFSHTADELTLKVRARSVGAWGAVCVGACVCPFFTYVFSGARAASLTSSTARRASLQPDAPALTRVLWFVCDVVDDVACGSVVVVCDLVETTRVVLRWLFAIWLMTTRVVLRWLFVMWLMTTRALCLASPGSSTPTSTAGLLTSLGDWCVHV